MKCCERIGRAGRLTWPPAGGIMKKNVERVNILDSSYMSTYALLVLSLASWIVPLIVALARFFRRKKKNLQKKQSTLGGILTISACIGGAVLWLRYAVGMAFVLDPETENSTLNWLEELGNSILHTLQTFSMDEDYTGYQLKGKELIEKAFGGNGFAVGLYSAYSTALNLVAPVVGGAAIFEILADVFPKLKLSAENARFWHHIFYFSELNEMSLALAKSISANSPGLLRKNVVVFTDAYRDNSNEQKSELLSEAKKMGAICLQQDLLHIRKRKRGNHTILLIDENEVRNLQCLSALTDELNYTCLNNAQIYLFTNDDAYVPLEKELWKKMEAVYGFSRESAGAPTTKLGKKWRAFKEEFGFVSKRMPILTPVKIYRNVVINMLRKLPLYEPLIGKEKNADGTLDLTVSIVGTGLIGTEMFLTTYWMGQIMGCNLKINLLSQESEEAFWSKIDYINPEIRRTLDPDDPILQINRRGEMSPVYATVSYTQCDVRSSAFVQKLQSDKRAGNLLDTDYFLVALGTDNDNMSVANTIKTYVGQHSLTSRKKKHTALAYVVYDGELAESMNRRKSLAFTGEETELYMCAVGALEEVFSVENVFMLKSQEGAIRANSKYSASSLREAMEKKANKRMKNEHEYWASTARSEHFGCKMFAAGLYERSLFDVSDGEVLKLWQERKALVKDFEALIKPPQKLEGAQREERLALLHKMAWLEHRRWNAFSRVYGLRGTNDWQQYINQTGNHKQMELKLHPCLVECDMQGIRAEFDENCILKEETAFRVTDPDQLDLLDELSYRLHACRTPNYSGLSYDFKLYDYPYYDL